MQMHILHIPCSFSILVNMYDSRGLILIGQMRMEQRAKAATMATPPVTATMM